MRKIIASLDIGSHTIKLVVGEIVKHKLNILACIETPARGIKKGLTLYELSLVHCRNEATRTPDPYVPNVVRYQLRYIPIAFQDCGATRNRTGDTRIFSPLLYQLSYGTNCFLLIAGAKVMLFFDTTRFSVGKINKKTPFE